MLPLYGPAKSNNCAIEVHGPGDFDDAFEGISKSRVNAVAVTEDGEFAASFKKIAALAIGNKLPSIGSKEYAEAGGLIGYGVNILTLYRRARISLTRY